MKGSIEDSLIHMIPKRFDYVGDVAVISIPSELAAYKEIIASKLFSMRGNTKAVLNKISKLEGEHRTADFELLLGKSTETVHRENGYIYKVDVKKVFFNPRLYSERKRVASKVIQDEYIIIPFAGVGPFVLPAAGKGAHVYAVEINPEACTCLKENIKINRLEDKITVLQADFEKFCRNRVPFLPSTDSSQQAARKDENSALSMNPSINMPICAESVINSEAFKLKIPQNGFDRAIVPTPYGMDHFLDEVSRLVRKEGYIHFYTFKAESQIPELIEKYKKKGFIVEFYKRCGNVAPGISRWVFDLIKKR